MNLVVLTTQTAEAFGSRLGSVGTWRVVVKRWGDAGR